MANASNSSIFIPDGSFDWSGGVDSSKVTTLASELNPSGLRRNQLAWLNNATVRGGGVRQRTGWQPLVKLLDAGRWQGGFMYEPDGANPYLVCQIDGIVYRVLLEAPYTITDLSGGNVLLRNPASAEMAFFVQGENYLVIQAGDYYTPGTPNPPITDADGRTLPLFWDGTTLRRSNGIIGLASVSSGGTMAEPVPVTYPLTITAKWKVPAVGVESKSISLAVAYPGALEDTGVLGLNGVMGTFQVTDIVAAPSTIKFTTISSKWAGSNLKVGIAAVPVDFTVIPPIEPPAPTPPPAPELPVNELPAATCMDYYGGRIWYAQSRQVGAGDMVGGPSGTLANRWRDSILKVTENPLVLGGDNFSLPTNAGNIRAIKHSSQLNESLGQGQLFIFTRKTVYMLTVPDTRTDWINANAQNQPKLTVVQITNGAVGDRCIVAVNGDLFYQSFDPSIRSLITAVRYFQQWGNTPISQNEQRALQGSNRALMRFSSAIEFDNRLLNLVLPVPAADGVNVVHSAIIPLDFDVVTNLEEKKPPVWEGAYDGLQFLQLSQGDFGGLERAFAAVISDVDGSLNIWELTTASRTENGDNRVTWAMESPAFTWTTAGLEYKLKQLKSGELWIDKISGTVEIDVYFRVDADPCWRRWLHTSVCAARNCAEQDPVKVCYPEEPACEGYRWTIVFPEPKGVCDSMGIRPTTIGYQFQCKVVIKGWCRVRGLLLYAIPHSEPQFHGIACPTTSIPQGMAKLPNPFT